MSHNEEVRDCFMIFEKLESVSGRNDKISILSKGINNKSLKKLLYLALDPYLTFGVKKTPKPKKLVKQTDYVSSYARFIRLTQQLSQRKLTGNAALDAIQKFFSKCTKLEYKWYDRILQKDLKCGTNAKTINKAFGEEIIKIFNIAKGESFKDYFPSSNNIAVEYKLDGIRCFAIKKSKDNVVLLSSSGRELFGYDEIEQAVKDLPGSKYILDCELISGGSFNATSSSRGKKEKGKKAILNIFDMIPIESMETGFYKAPYYKRKKELYEFFNDIDSNVFNIVKYTGPFEITDYDDQQLIDVYETALEEGFEGIMLKVWDSPYTWKRTRDWIKMKPEESFDGEIIDVEEGTGKNKGRLGAFIVEVKQGMIVRVGGGYKDHERIEFWNKRKEMIGKIIEFKGQEITDNKSGTHSVRFPNFKRLREDKQH